MRQAVILLTFLWAAAAAAQSDVGVVAFANSGAPAAQEPFLRGLAQLHNFEYASAAELFRKAQQIDGSFAMAFWGEAMTYTHPIWFQQDLGAARKVLARAPQAKTERERDYLKTLDVLYGDGTKNERDVLYSEAMGKLHAKYTDDVDATAFYALSILGTAHEGRDFATYMRAAALLEEVFPANRRHPGVLHYLIHSYDDPVHAPLGMRAARLYGGVAPHAGHALHMTSHIFVALGMWDEVIDANRRAIAASKGDRRMDCGHYPIWLHYGYLQTRRNDDARKMLDDCRVGAFASDTSRQRLADYADMLANHVAAGLPLGDADRLAPPDGVSAPNAAFTMAYAGVLAAAQRGDAAAMQAAVSKLRDAYKARETENTPGRRMRADVMMQEGEVLLLVANGKRAEAIALLEKIAENEHEMPLEFGPPEIAKPAAELLAEQLIAAGRPDDAAAAYRRSLQRAPGRIQSAVHVH